MQGEEDQIGERVLKDLMETRACSDESDSTEQGAAIRSQADNISCLRPWRVAFLEERVFRWGRSGPLERAPLALDEIVRLKEDIADLHLHFTMGATGGDR